MEEKDYKIGDVIVVEGLYFRIYELVQKLGQAPVLKIRHMSCELKKID